MEWQLAGIGNDRGYLIDRFPVIWYMPALSAGRGCGLDGNYPITLS